MAQVLAFPSGDVSLILNNDTSILAWEIKELLLVFLSFPLPISLSVASQCESLLADVIELAISFLLQLH